MTVNCKYGGIFILWTLAIIAKLLYLLLLIVTGNKEERQPVQTHQTQGVRCKLKFYKLNEMSCTMFDYVVKSVNNDMEMLR